VDGALETHAALAEKRRAFVADALLRYESDVARTQAVYDRWYQRGSAGNGTKFLPRSAGGS